MMEFEIKLNDLLFYSFHGVMEEEKKIGNEFKVSLKISIPYSEGIKEDKLESTISYADLYSIINEQMKNKCNLLETVATRIADEITVKYPQILPNKNSITIEKRRPPIQGMLGSASITLKF